MIAVINFKKFKHVVNNHKDTENCNRTGIYFYIYILLETKIFEFKNFQTHLSKFEFHKSACRLVESVVLRESISIKKSKGFSEDEESLIVATINKCTETDFNKYDIKKSELKRLMAYKEKHGKFKTFNDILVIQDVPSLVRLCRSILDGGKRKVIIKSTGPSKCTTMPAIDKITKQVCV